jgi:hypothetical protein
MKLKHLVALVIASLLSGCTLESITFKGRFADYVIKPRNPIVIDAK